MNKQMITILFLSSFATLNVFAQEGGLKMPLNFENAKVLPKGIRNVRFLNSQIDAIDKFDGSGNIVPLGNKLNKKVTWKDVIKGKETTDEKSDTYALMKAVGDDENDSIGRTTGMVNASVDAKVPVIAYGISEKLTAALVIPYVSDDINIDTGYLRSQGFNRDVNEKLNDSNKSNKAYQVQQNTLNAINKKLKDKGYDSLTDSEGRRSRLGDVKLVTKYQYMKQDKLAQVLKVEVTAPTGEATDPDKAVDIGTGDEQWDLGLGIGADYYLNDALSFTGFVGYTFQLATTTRKRIWEESNSKISGDADNNTEVDLGDHFKSQILGKYSFLNGWSVYSGVTYQFKEADKYDGDKYSQKRYNWMSRDTAQNMLATQAGIGFSTLPLFRQKKFKVPLETNIYYTNVNEGMNTLVDEVYTFELAMFF